MRPCSSCKLPKADSEFYKDATRPSGFYRYCKVCSNEKRRLDAKRNPDKYRNSRLKHYFGITMEQYRKLLKSQKDVCAICSQPEQKKLLAVDHDHRTGKIRGLLCSNCNMGLGKFKDDKELLKKAVLYLLVHS